MHVGSSIAQPELDQAGDEDSSYTTCKNLFRLVFQEPITTKIEAYESHLLPQGPRSEEHFELGKGCRVD
jgi:hypothetical protein